MWENPSGGAPYKQRQQTLKRDHYQCVKCGSTQRLEVDHIINVARGGTHNLDNLQTLCHHCHREKSQQEAHQARAAKRARLKLPPAHHPGVK